MTNELAETTVQRDEWKRIAEDRGIELERLRRDMAALQSQWDDMQQGFVEVFGEPVRDAIELLGTVERIRSGNEPFPSHPDPTGQTREPPHCPTCECGMCGCPDEYCLKLAGSLKPGIRCADDGSKKSGGSRE